MTKLLIGRSPLTTITGYLMAAIVAIHHMAVTGSARWQDYLLPVLMAIFGRLAADEHEPPLPPAAVPEPCKPVPGPDSFLRRGLRHRQRRDSHGRFAMAY